jgi:hypothetical protein
MTKVKKPEVWIIQHKETKEQWAAGNGKSSWGSSGAAKSAYSYNSLSRKYYFEHVGPRTKFKDQNEYEVVALFNYQELEYKYNQLISLVCEMAEVLGKDGLGCFEGRLEELGIYV